MKFTCVVLMLFTFVSVIVVMVPLVKEEGMLKCVIITIHESIMIMGMTF